MLGYVARRAKRTYTAVGQAAPPVIFHHLDAHLVPVASRVKPRSEILRAAKLGNVVGEKNGRDDRVSVNTIDQAILSLQLAQHQI
jgi:hypothetical protein